MTDVNSSPSITMWCTNHNLATPMLDIPGLTPIYAGAAADVMQGQAVCDILQDGSRARNDYYSELSAMYKVWKQGPKSDIVGWCHYRRYFHFGETQLSRSGWLLSTRQDIINNLSDFIPQNLSTLCTDRSFVVVDGHELDKSIYENYKECHHVNDYLDYMKILLRVHPELAPYLGDQFRKTTIHPCDMFICTWQVFDEICNLWFTTLDEFINHREIIHQDTYQNRAPSFLSERAFDAWVQFKRDQGFLVHELPVIKVHGE
jgi:hypothetical protein